MPTHKTLGILALAGVNPYVEKPNEEYMNDAQLEHFKKILDALKKPYNLSKMMILLFVILVALKSVFVD